VAGDDLPTLGYDLVGKVVCLSGACVLGWG
jgi:hypothetical protein